MLTRRTTFQIFVPYFLRLFFFFFLPNNFIFFSWLKIDDLALRIVLLLRDRCFLKKFLFLHVRVCVCIKKCFIALVSATCLLKSKMLLVCVYIFITISIWQWQQQFKRNHVCFLIFVFVLIFVPLFHFLTNWMCKNISKDIIHMEHVKQNRKQQQQQQEYDKYTKAYEFCNLFLMCCLCVLFLFVHGYTVFFFSCRKVHYKQCYH